MARDRSIKLIIQAQVEGAKRALRDTADAAKKVGDESEKASKKSTTASQRLVHSARDNAEAWNTVGGTVVAAGAALTAGFAAATVANLGFERQLSNVRAVTNASASEMDALAESALEMGAATVFSASEAAEAQAELARAGVSTSDILGGALKGSMDLAAAGGLELADAAIISAQAMNLFNLEGAEVSHIADVLASGANKSAADVADLGQALGQAGTVASQTGLTLEETVAALSMFADAGIRGSDAGTSLKSMLQRLTPQSKEAQRVLDDLGFSAFDAQGNFIGLQALAGELQDSFGGLDTESRQAALGVAFGSDAIRAASVLMEGGVAAARDYEDAMNDQGAAARMAATQMDNLAGDWEELTGAMETALIQGGSAANGFLRGMVTAATEVVNVYNAMPGYVQGGITALSGVAGAAALAIGGVVLAVPKLVQVNDAFRTLSTTSPRLATGIGKVGRAAGIAAGAAAVGALVLSLSELGQALYDGERTAEELENTLTRIGRWDGPGLSDLFGEIGGITDFNSELERLANPNTWQTINRGVTDFGDGLLAPLGDARTESARLRGGLEQLDGVLARMDAGRARTGFVDLAGEMDLTRQGAADLLDLLPTYRDTLVSTATEMGIAATDANLLKIAYGEIGPEAEAAAAGAAQLTPEMEAQQAAASEAAQALAEYQAELAGASGSFIDSAGAYAVATAAAQEWAQGVADSTDSAEDSWETYVADFTGTKDEYLAELERMAEAQTMWEENLLGLIARGVPEQFVQSLAEMGPASADEVALIASMTDEELAKWVGLMEKRGGEGSAAFAANLTSPDVLAVLAAAGQQLGDEALAALVAALAAGEVTPQEAIDRWNLEVEIGGNTDPLVTETDAALAEVDGKTATPTVDPDVDPEGKTAGWVYDTNLQRPVPVVDPDLSTAEGKVVGWYYDTASMRPVPIVDADTGPAVGSALWWRDLASGLVAVAGVDAQDRGATWSAQGIVNSISRMWAYINVGTRYAGGLNMGGADPTRHSARATGGVERRPMLAGPQYGRTNLILWGEPETRGEAFISNHPAYRTENVEYLRTAASWFGLDLVRRYAAGNMMAPTYTAPPPVGGPVSMDAGPIASAVASAVAAASPTSFTLMVDGRELHATVASAAADNARRGGR